MLESHERRDDDAFNEVIAEFMMRIDNGENVNRDAFIAEHPDFAAALKDYLAILDAVNALVNADVEKPSSSSGEPSVPDEPNGSSRSCGTQPDS